MKQKETPKKDLVFRNIEISRKASNKEKSIEFSEVRSLNGLRASKYEAGNSISRVRVRSETSYSYGSGFLSKYYSRKNYLQDIKKLLKEVSPV